MRGVQTCLSVHTFLANQALWHCDLPNLVPDNLNSGHRRHPTNNTSFLVFSPFSSPLPILQLSSLFSLLQLLVTFYFPFPSSLSYLFPPLSVQFHIDTISYCTLLFVSPKLNVNSFIFFILFEVFNLVLVIRPVCMILQLLVETIN